LLVNASTTTKEGYKDYKRTEYRLGQLKRKNPRKYDAVINKVLAALNEVEKAVDASVRD
jgi:hypothetical protein